MVGGGGCLHDRTQHMARRPRTTAHGPQHTAHGPQHTAHGPQHTTHTRVLVLYWVVRRVAPCHPSTRCVTHQACHPPGMSPTRRVTQPPGVPPTRRVNQVEQVVVALVTVHQGHRLGLSSGSSSREQLAPPPPHLFRFACLLVHVLPPWYRPGTQFPGI